eukprot:213287-Prymnesium_polylepis.1
MRGVPMWQLAGGTDDLANAYRHVPADDPRVTCVVQIQGQAAVMQFNRFPEATTAITRRLLGV